jgi:hypothetical protein
MKDFFPIGPIQTCLDDCCTVWVAGPGERHGVLESVALVLKK